MLEDVARYHNYTPNELLVAIGSGELATVLLPEEQRSMAIRWLTVQSGLADDLTLAEALMSIAKQLEAAAKREEEE